MTMRVEFLYSQIKDKSERARVARRIREQLRSQESEGTLAGQPDMFPAAFRMAPATWEPSEDLIAESMYTERRDRERDACERLVRAAYLAAGTTGVAYQIRRGKEVIFTHL
jgi:hypothetical protein